MEIEGVFSVNKIDIARQANIRINTVLQKINGIDIRVFCRADVGAEMGLLNHCRKVLENSVVSLNHEANQVILLAFWASWCKFSQEPMAQIKKMIDTKGKKWGPQVRVIALSIDQDWSKNKDAITAQGLTGMEHYNVKSD